MHSRYMRHGVELQRELDKINQDNLLREDELEKFKLILETERRIREARSKEEEDKVMVEIRQAGLLREIDFVVKSFSPAVTPEVSASSFITSALSG